MIDSAQSLRTSEDHLSALMQAIHSADVFVLYQTPDLVYRWAKNLPNLFKNKWHVDCRDADFFDAELADNMETIKLQVLASGTPQTLEAYFKQGEQPIWYRFSVDRHRNEQGEILGLVTTGVNVSELRRREQVLKILLREVSHRSKNLLAIIQSIANQTAGFSNDIQDFVQKFHGRLQSLSQSQDLVTESNWRGASFLELLHIQSKDYFPDHNNAITANGDNPYLFPGAALHIGLALHELIVNSLSYGALVHDGGRISITCYIEHKLEECPQAVISWHEFFIPDANHDDTVNKAQFGSAVLERIVPIAIGGDATYEIGNGHVTYRLTVPSTQFDPII